MASPTPVLPDVGSTMVLPASEQSLVLRRVDHGQGGAVLDASARVEVLELGQEMAAKMSPGSVEAHQGCVADEIDQVVSDVHRRPLLRRWPGFDTGGHDHRLISEQHHRQAGLVDPVGYVDGRVVVANDAHQPGNVTA